MAKTLEKVKKHLNYLFLNTTTGAAAGSETWARVGKSTEWTDTMNAKSTTHDYIEDSSPTDIVESYQPSTNIPLTAYIGDPVYEYIFNIASKQITDAATDVLRVFQNKAIGGTGNIAQKTKCSITIDSNNIGTGVITFNIKQAGTPTLGTATVSTATDGTPTPQFTPDAA